MAINGWIILDKPIGLGSTQAVSAVKRALREAGEPKTRVGHGGTLDPLANGVLPIAIGEASALVIPEADPGVDLVASFWFGRGSMTVDLHAEAIDDPPLDTESFAWQVLDTMAQDASAGSDDGRFHVRFTVTSAVGSEASSTV